MEAIRNICVATLNRGGITVCSPNGGPVEFAPVPGDTHFTNVCFGAPGGCKAYVAQSYAGRLIEIE